MSFHVPEQYRFFEFGSFLSSDISYGNNGFFIIPIGDLIFKAQASDGEGWEHVSISLNQARCPTWEEMCLMKSIFWDDEDTVVQFHPAKSQYRCLHPYCLHLWRSTKYEFPLPDPIMIS